jgi:transposase-like protein
VINLPGSIVEQGVKEMITMKDLGIIRRLYFRDGLSLSEIERRIGVTRKTVRRWLKAPEGTEPKYRRRPVTDTKIAPFAEQLISICPVRPTLATVRESPCAIKGGAGVVLE